MKDAEHPAIRQGEGGLDPHSRPAMTASLARSRKCPTRRVAIYGLSLVDLWVQEDRQLKADHLAAADLRDVGGIGSVRGFDFLRANVEPESRRAMGARRRIRFQVIR